MKCLEKLFGKVRSAFGQRRPAIRLDRLPDIRGLIHVDQRTINISQFKQQFVEIFYRVTAEMLPPLIVANQCPPVFIAWLHSNLSSASTAVPCHPPHSGGG